MNHIDITKIEEYIHFLKTKGYSNSDILRKLKASYSYIEWAYDHDLIDYSNFQQIKDTIDTYIHEYQAIIHSLDNLIPTTPLSPISKKNSIIQRFSHLLEKVTASPNLTSDNVVNSNEFTKISPPVYFVFIIVLTIMSILSAGIYDRFFAKTGTSLAYPSSPTVGARILSFQGRLTDSLGNPINVATNMQFRLYTASSGGTTLYDSGTCSISPDLNDQDGVFNVLIGSDCGAAITSSVFTEYTEVWLGVKVGTDTEMTPRQRIANVPYAMNAETLQGLPVGTEVSTIPYINAGGDLLMAASSPQVASTYASQTFLISSANAVTLQSAGAGDVTLTATESGTIKFLTGGSQAASFNNSGDLIMANGNQVQLGNLAADPTAIGAGALYYNTADNKVYYYNNSSWVALSSGASSQLWQVNTAALSPIISSYDVLVGSTATGSAMVKLPGTTNSDAIFNLGTGKVGIGDQTPDAKLEVSGAVVGKALAIFSETGDQDILVASAGATTRFRIANGGAFYGGYYADITDNNYGIDPAGTTNFGNYSLKVTGGALLAYDSGSVGIGAQSPTGKLQVTGDETRFGDAGSIGYATGDGDVYVEDVLEVDGTLYGNNEILSFSTSSSNQDALNIAATQTAATGGTLRGINLSADFSGTSGTQQGVNGLDFTVKASGSGGTVSYLKGISAWGVIGGGATVSDFKLVDAANPTNSGTINYLAGLVTNEMTSGTNNTDVLIGTSSIPSGNYAIYNASTRANFFGGSLEVDGTLYAHGNSIQSSTAEALSLSADDVSVVGCLNVGSASECTTQGNAQLSGILDVNGGDGSDFAGGVTFNDDVDMTFAGTENLGITSDLAGSVNVINIAGTPSSSAGTVYGLYIDQVDSANTNGYDASLVIDNSDTNLAIADGILLVSGGGGFTDFIDTPSSVFKVDGSGNITGLDLTITGGDITGVASAAIDLGEAVAGDIYINTDVFLGGTSETLANTNFVLDGNDMFIADTLGVEGNVYTDGSFKAGATLTLSDSAIEETGDLLFKPNSDADDYIYLTTATNEEFLYFEDASLAYTNDPGFKLNSTSGELEYRDENSSSWVSFDSLASGGAPGGNDTYIQYNNGGVFGGIAEFTYNDGTGEITMVDDFTLTLAGTENLNIASDLAGSVNVVNIEGTPSSSAGTAYGLYIDQINSANSNGYDASLVIDNSDTNLAIADGVLFVSAGGGFTDFIDTPSSVFKVDGSGNITGVGATLTGDLAVNGDDITADGAFTINSASYVRIGDTSTPGSASGDDDLYVESDIEVDGTLYAHGNTIYSSTAEAISLSSDDVAVAGCLHVGSNAECSSLGNIELEEGAKRYIYVEDDSDTTGGDALSIHAGNSTGSNGGDLYLDSGTSGIAAATNTYINSVSLGDVFLRMSSAGASDFDIWMDGTYYHNNLATTTGGIGWNALNINTSTWEIRRNTSSARYKNNIRPLNDDPYKILTVDPKEWEDSQSGDFAIGFIAEEFAAAGLNNLLVVDNLGRPEGLQYPIFSAYMLPILKDHNNYIAREKNIINLAQAPTNAPSMIIDSNGDTTLTGDVVVSKNISGSEHTLNALPDQESLVANAGFEVDSDNSGLPDNWTGDGIKETVNVNQGSTAVQIPQQNGRILGSCVPVSGNQQYNLNLFARTTTSSDNLTSGIFQYTSHENCLSHTNGTLLPTLNNQLISNTYNQYGASITTDATSRWARVSIENKSNMLPSSLLYVDAVRLTQSSENNGLDLAETYPVDPTNKPGVAQLVSMGSAPIQSADIPGVIKTAKQYDNSLFGVVSTQAGYILDDGGSYEKVKVALKGRVPVLVTSENGPIAIGDPITSSSIPGVGMKATHSGKIIGYAMTSYDNPNVEVIDQVIVFVNPEMYIDLSILTDLQEKVIQFSTQTAPQIATHIGSTLVHIENAVIDTIDAGLITAEQLVAQSINATTATINSLTSDTVKTNVLESNKITTEEFTAKDATVSGKLIAQEVDAENIRELRERLEKVALNQTEATSSATLQAEVENIQHYLDEMQNQEQPSTPSLQLADLDEDLAIDSDVTPFNIDRLIVTGDAAATSLAVADSLTAGDIFIQNNSILSLNNELKLSALENVNILNGAVMIAKDGTIKAKGEIIAEKGVRTNSIKPLDHEYGVGLDLAQNNLAITNNDLVVASINASGSAKFNDLSVSTYTQATDSAAIIAAPDAHDMYGIDSPAIETNATAAGNGVIPAQHDTITIFNTNITADSLIYITPTSKTYNYNLYVETTKPCAPTEVQCKPYFSVHIDGAVKDDITFNWWIVN